MSTTATTFTGEGTVMRKDAPLATVSYTLIQKVDTSGIVTIEGWLDWRSGGRIPLYQGKLTLVLADARTVVFDVIEAKPTHVPRQYHISASDTRL